MSWGELLFPSLRWDAEKGYEGQRALIDQALALGVGGFTLFGGRSDAVSALTEELRERSSVPLLIASDLERGAGQQFVGATGLPPLAALGWLGDSGVMRQAAALTAREARALGVDWVFAPVLDLDGEPDNPIIGTRAIGAEPDEVAQLAAAWIEGCQAEHVLACGKHFPGHGRTTADSHAVLPVVAASRETLESEDLAPFRAAVEAGVASIMTAHVAYPALDPAGVPATLSRALLRGLLREELGFHGLIVTDALIMAGVRQGDSEARASVKALDAGCDLLLYPEDLAAVLREIEAAVANAQLDAADLERSRARRREWQRWAAEGAGEASGSSEADRAFAEGVAREVVHLVQGETLSVSRRVAVTVVDDDVGGPFPSPSRDPFYAALRSHGFEIADGPGGAGTVVVALFGDIRAWKGRPGYSKLAIDRVHAAVTGARDAVVLQFSHPRLAKSLGIDAPIVTAWGGEAAMQSATAAWLGERIRT